MSDTTTSIKHMVSPLARQTLLDGDLTRPVAGRRPIRLLPWLQQVGTIIHTGTRPARAHALRPLAAATGQGAPLRRHTSEDHR